MTDITKYTKLPTVQAIYEAYERNASDWRRNHLGASLIGDNCKRKLWYTFHWCTAPNHSGKLLRLFERGQNEEAVFVKNLRDAGVKVLERDPKTGKQFSYDSYGGHFAGSLDGVCEGLKESSKQHVLEFKTSSAKAFADLEKHGVQKSKPLHYAQMQTYMAWSGLDRALYLAVNKDNDDIYGERVKYDEAFASEIFAKAKSIIESPTPPEKLSQDPAYFECKFCDHYKICQGSNLPEVNCRTCSHSTPELTGGWSCARYGHELVPSNVQREGCGVHVYQPIFFKGREVDNFMNDTVTYSDGTKNGLDGVSSVNLMALFNGGAPEMAQDQFVNDLMTKMGAKVVGVNGDAT